MKTKPSGLLLKKSTVTRAAIVAGALLTGALGTPAHAQSSDALIDKLVEKGILTVKEANDLRVEADNDFKRASAARSGLPDWVNSMKIYGDVRVRYEQIMLDNGLVPDRNRFRYRIRPGLTVNMQGGLEAGVRFTSSEQGSGGGDPISGNATFGDNASKKFLFVDLAYGKWTPINHKGFTLGGTVGKMENPFTTSDMVFDPDYTPEGGAIQASYAPSDRHTLRFNGGGFVLDETGPSSDDPWMLGLQGRWDGKYAPREGGYGLESSLGVGFYKIFNSKAGGLSTASVPDRNSGNTREGGDLVYDYYPIVVDASLTYNLKSMPFYPGAFPIKLGGEFIYNPGAGAYQQNPAQSAQDTAWTVGILFGKAGKRGTWEIGYRYERLEGDAWWEELTDSDFGGANYLSESTASYYAGTNLRGHIIRASYAFTDALAFTFKYWLTSQIVSSGPDTGAQRMQADLQWKF